MSQCGVITCLTTPMKFDTQTLYQKQNTHQETCLTLLQESGYLLTYAYNKIGTHWTCQPAGLHTYFKQLRYVNEVHSSLEQTIAIGDPAHDVTNSVRKNTWHTENKHTGTEYEKFRSHNGQIFHSERERFFLADAIGDVQWNRLRELQHINKSQLLKTQRAGWHFENTFSWRLSRRYSAARTSTA